MAKSKGLDGEGSSERLLKLPPSAPEARDEGPRLLPLDHSREEPTMEHYVGLADVALGNNGSTGLRLGTTRLRRRRHSDKPE